ncbi:MAG: EamA family transporter [Desulfobacterales bacterium]|nr:EamA family transporter [Desulfobacterales bacterium]
MDIHIAMLVLLAAFLHAGWNAIVKTASDRLLVISSVALGQCLAGVLALPFVPVPDPASWAAIGVSALFHYAYYVFLINAYRFGDLSQVYPLARGVAPVLVAVGAAIFGGEMLALPAVAGVVMASTGIASIAFFQKSSLKGNWAALFFAGGTGVIIAGYTVADGIGVRLSGNPFGYIAWLFLFEFPVLVFVFYRRRGRLLSLLKREWLPYVGTGISSVLAYSLVIFAVAFAPMAAVSALRESSVIIAAMIGTLILGERPWRLRVAAAVMVAGGVTLIAGIW